MLIQKRIVDSSTYILGRVGKDNVRVTYF